MHDRKLKPIKQCEALVGTRLFAFAVIAALGGTTLECRGQPTPESERTSGSSIIGPTAASTGRGVIKMPGVTIKKRPQAPTRRPVSVSATQEALVKASCARAEAGEYLQAIAECNRAISMGPYAPAFYQRGVVRQKIGQYQEAVVDYNSAIRIDPRHALAHVNRGWCRKKLGDVPSSIQDFNQAIAIDPTCAQAYSNRASSKMQMGDLQGAFADSNEALRLNPDAVKQIGRVISKPYETAVLTQDKYESGGKRPRAVAPELAKLNNQAVQYINKKNFPGAIKILETVLGNDPGYEYARNNLSIAYNNFGLSMSSKYPLQSINQFRTALFFNPNETTTRDNLDSMLKHVGQNPRAAEVREQLGDELRTTGDLKAAFVEYTEALRLKNDPTLRRKLAQVLIALDGPVESPSDIPKQDEEPTIIGFAPRGGNISIASMRKQIAASTAGDGETVAASKDCSQLAKPQDASSQDAKPQDVKPQDAEPQEVKTSDASVATKAVSDRPSELMTDEAKAVAEKLPERVPETKPVETTPTAITALAGKEKKSPNLEDATAVAAQPDAFKSDGVEDDVTRVNPIGTLHVSVPASSAATPKELSKDQRAAGIAHWERVMKAGVVELDRGNYPAAEAAFTEAIAVAEQLNNDSFLLVRSLDMLTTAIMNQGRLNEATAPMKRALKIRETTLLPDHPEIARSYERYARLLAKTGNRGEAAVYETRAQEIWKKRSQDGQEN